MTSATTHCPACGTELAITLTLTDSTAPVSAGPTRPCSFCRLSDENVRFLELFVMCRGNIKEMERETGLGYWTIRSRLDRVIETLELVAVTSDTDDDPDARRRDILVAVERGDLAPEEAERMLAHLANRPHSDGAW